MKQQTKYGLYSFLVNLLLGIILISVGFLMGDGIFYQGTDFNYEQILFSDLARNSIINGEYLWLDNFDMGTSFINALSFYTTGSPFFWLSFLFKNINFALLVPIFMVIKFAVAGTGAYLYVKQYVNNPKFALLASILYAFSGFQLYNLNYHFQDVIAIFPFLLLSLDKNIKDDKVGWFAFMVALAAINNYFFFVAEVVFLLIYFIVKTVLKDYVINKKIFVRLVFESIIGVSISMFVLLPNVTELLLNPRVSESIFSLPIFKQIFLEPYQYMDIIKSLLIPSEGVFNRAMILRTNVTAPEMYLPIFGIIPVCSYIWKNKKDWLSVICIISFVFMLNPILNSSFVAFNSEYYSRWLYMPILIFALVAVKHLENGDSIKIGLIIWTSLFVSFFIVGNLLGNSDNYMFIHNMKLSFVLIVLSVIGVLVTIYIYKNVKKRNVIVFLFFAIFAQVTVNFVLNMYYTHNFWDDNYDTAEKLFYEAAQMKYPDSEEYYRVDTKDFYINAGLISDRPSINVFGSNVTGTIFEFYNANNVKRTVNSAYSNELYGFHSLLGVKYVILPEGSCLEEGVEGFSSEPVFNNIGYDFYENLNFVGMGFAYENAISEKEYAMIPDGKKHLVSMDALVLNESDMTKYYELFNVKSANNYNEFDYLDFKESIEEKRYSSAFGFNEKNGRYSFETIVNKDTIYFVPIPYDKNFKAFVDGNETKVIKVNNGLTGILVHEGKNDILLSYDPVELKIGLIITVVSILLFIIYLLKIKK